MHLPKIYSWPNVFEGSPLSHLRFLMPPMSDKLHTVVPLLIPQEGSAGAQNNPCAHNTCPDVLVTSLPLEQH